MAHYAQRTLTLTSEEAAFLREAIAARHALEIWTGDGTYFPPDGVDDQELYNSLGGRFSELEESMVRLAHPHTASARAVKALWDAASQYHLAAASG